MNRFRSSVSAGIMLASMAAMPSAQAVTFVNSLVVPGNRPDLSPLNGGPGGVNVNRLGMFSDIVYDRFENVYYGLSDRGPGGGFLNYETRVQKFTLDVDLNTGAISNFQVVETIKFSHNGAPFNGLNPLLLNGDKKVLGNSFDPEGFVVGRDGTFFVSDEYGPSVFEFRRDGTLIRKFTPPANLLPKEADSDGNFVDGRGTITTGRQDNRGYEGLTVSPDGTKLYAVLQDPLVNEGTDGDGDLLDGEGRRSRNVRVVEYDVATGVAGRQFIYQLEDRAAINARVPGTDDDFGATQQGRNIGLSSIFAVNDHQFLVIERDNRGVGVDPLLQAEVPNPVPDLEVVGSKRVFLIDINGATDVSGKSFNNTNGLIPDGDLVAITPVSKVATPYIDVQAALENAGLVIPEKLEGFTVGPQLADGSYLLLLGTDNDYSVTQNDSNVQFDAYASPDFTTVVLRDLNSLTTLDGIDVGPLEPGYALIPGFLYAFRSGTDDEVATNFQPILPQIPEPASTSLGLVGLGALMLRRRREA